MKNAPWKIGEGDVVREVADACKKYGLKFGVYLLPRDRNRADYGKPDYITYFRNQLTELLTGYGPVFEVWFDDANGGTGYCGGANENRGLMRRPITTGRTLTRWFGSFSPRSSFGTTGRPRGLALGRHGIRLRRRNELEHVERDGRRDVEHVALRIGRRGLVGTG